MRIKLPNEFDPPLSYEEWNEYYKHKMQEKKEKDEILRTLFPTLSQIPLPWLLLALACLAFNAFTLFLI